MRDRQTATLTEQPTPDLGGRRPTHGARLLDRVYHQNQLDPESDVGKLLRSVEDDLARDQRGGSEHTTAADQIKIRRAAFLHLICSAIETWVLRQPEPIVNGELIAVLKKGYATHQANLIRVLESLGLRVTEAGSPSFVPEIVWPPNRTPASAGGPQSDGRARDKAKPAPDDNGSPEGA